MRTPRVILSLLLLSLAPAPARAERLPVRGYTTVDGLAHDRVEQIFRDSRGFLWFCTMDGLSRFDGYEFKNYGTGEGLSSSRTSDIAETGDGSYWVATDDGVGRFDTVPRAGPHGPGGSAFFTHYAVGDSPSSNRVSELYVDASGRLWAGTAAGLFLFFPEGGAGEFRRAELNVGVRPDEMLEVSDIAGDGEGTLWLTTEHGLVRRTAGGRAALYAAPGGKTEDNLWAVLTDEAGRVWVGGDGGLLVFKPDESRGLAASPVAGLPEAAGEWRRFGAADGLGVDDVRALLRSRDGHVWAGTRGGGLSEIDESGRVRRFGAANGLSDVVMALREDGEGHIWVGTPAGGVLKLSRRGLTSYGEADGLGSTEVVSIFEDGGGEVCVVTAGVYVNRYEGGRFVAVRPRLPAQLLGPVKHRDPVIRDHAGEWWVATTGGIFRFPAVGRLEELARTPPRNVYTRADGLADTNVNRIYEDARGDLWFGSYTPPLVLTRWERATDTFHVYTDADGIPAQNFADTFGSDAGGTLWVGLHNGGVMRYRGGRFESFGAEAGVPGGIVLALYTDRARRLWVGTSGGGAARLDDTASERPRFVTLTKADGLSSNMMRAFAEDGAGALYVGTARGVDRFGAGEGRVLHYTTDDGLPTGEVTAALRDRRGALWFGTRGGLARLDPPAPDPPLEAPPAFISAVRVAGVAQPVPEVGAAEVGGLALDYAQRQLQVEFVGPGFGAGGRLRYQYMLEGLDREWGAPTEQRSVSYAHLAPGSYRFLVRAVTADGAAGGRAAVVAFRVVPPVWMRWWFVSLVLLCLAALAFTLRRLRRARRAERERVEDELRRAKEERLAELERVRKRIATDLHDDIGASLTQIAVLSEVARQRAGAGSEQLAQITAVSNELVESMSDIVWAINPKKDRLSDLTQRMRRFASDVFTARGLRFHFDASGADGDVRLGADLRREVFLIFKESVNNAVKHSGAARAEVEFRLEGGELLLRVADDGRGFDATVAERSGEYERTVGGRGGNGLRSLFQRARELGGTYEVRSAPGAGTTVSLRVPLRHHHPYGR